MIYYGYKGQILVKGSFTDLMEEEVEPLSVMELISVLTSRGVSLKEARQEMEQAIYLPLQYDEEGHLLA